MSIADKKIIMSANNVTIAENEQRVYKAGQLNVLANAESLNGSLSGKSVSANDVIDIEHIVGCNVSSKNLCNIFGYSAQLITTMDTARVLSNSYGTTISTIDTSDTIEVTQSNYSDDVSYEGHYSNGRFFIGFDTSVIPVGSEVTLSFDLEVTNNLGNKSRIIISENGNSAVESKHSVYFVNGRNSLTFTDWRDLYSTPNVGFEIRLNGISGIFSNFQVEIGSITTPFTPYVSDFSSVNVSRYGKNLFEFKQGYVDKGTVIEKLENGAICQGVVYDNNQHNSWGNGWYTFANKATATLKAGDVVTISCDYTVLELAEGRSMDDFNRYSNKKVNVHLYHSSDGTKNLTGTAQNQPTILGEPARLYITYTVKADGDYYPIFTLNSNKVRIENIQIEIGSTTTSYEPFKEPTTYQSTAEGIVNGITSIAPNMTLLTDTEGVIINANYYKDPDIVISNLAQSVALSGGEG